MTDNHHFFGGEHTDMKLECLRQYLSAFSIALKKQKFTRLYIDAFAGTGTRNEVRPSLPIFGSMKNEIVTTQGSATIALSIEPEFHHIILIEQDPDKASALRKLIGEKRARVREGDANEIVQRICQKIDQAVRGVIFLDPYGMEVEWKTVEAIANTKVLDCWYFFPLSGLYRNAPHDPIKSDPKKIDALNRVLGTNEWRQAWYDPSAEDQQDLFSSLVPEERIDVNAIEKYVGDRLRTVFQAVLPPLRIYNARNAPLASLFFAISNPSPKAIALATTMAAHILKRGMSSQTRSR